MNPIRKLEREHDDINRELIEFEVIMDSDVVNYPNLVHVFRRFCAIWEDHEAKEEGVFEIMNRKHLTLPVERISLEHKELAGHIVGIKDAINSGDDYLLRKSFESDLSVLVGKIRKHMEIEDEVLYTISPKEFSEEELGEMNEVLSNYS